MMAPHPKKDRPSIDFIDHTADKTYRVENLNIDIQEDDMAVYTTVAISGKVYHPDYGFFEISTDPVLEYYYANDYPVAGTVILSGADSTYASATFNADGTYTLSIYDGIQLVEKTCDSVTDVCQ